MPHVVELSPLAPVRDKCKPVHLLCWASKCVNALMLWESESSGSKNHLPIFGHTTILLCAEYHAQASPPSQKAQMIFAFCFQLLGWAPSPIFSRTQRDQLCFATSRSDRIHHGLTRPPTAFSISRMCFLWVMAVCRSCFQKESKYEDDTQTEGGWSSPSVFYRGTPPQWNVNSTQCNDTAACTFTFCFTFRTVTEVVHVLSSY